MECFLYQEGEQNNVRSMQAKKLYEKSNKRSQQVMRPDQEKKINVKSRFYTFFHYTAYFTEHFDCLHDIFLLIKHCMRANRERNAACLHFALSFSFSSSLFSPSFFLVGFIALSVVNIVDNKWLFIFHDIWFIFHIVLESHIDVNHKINVMRC